MCQSCFPPIYNIVFLFFKWIEPLHNLSTVKKSPRASVSLSQWEFLLGNCCASQYCASQWSTTGEPFVVNVNTRSQRISLQSDIWLVTPDMYCRLNMQQKALGMETWANSLRQALHLEKFSFLIDSSYLCCSLYDQSNRNVFVLT